MLVEISIYIFFYIAVSFSIIFLIFWLIFYSVGFMLKKKKHNDERLIYECGFKNFSNINLGLNLGFFWSASLIILYELEILFILPVLINPSIFTPISFSLSLFFLCLLNLTIFADLKLKIIKWTY